jgi:hypothetical protein
VFIDETRASTKMARRCGRAPRGARCRAPIPHGHWKTTTFVGALRLEGVTTPMVLDGAMNLPAFLAYVEQALAPTLTPGDIVVMDMRGEISSVRLSKIANSDLRSALAPVRTVVPCSIRKAQIWLIFAVRRDTRRERTRCNDCKSNLSCIFS